MTNIIDARIDDLIERLTLGHEPVGLDLIDMTFHTWL